MEIKLYTNKSPNEKIGKKLTLLKTLTGNLKNETSIIDPTILVCDLDNDIIKKCNYIYIPRFGRYYFLKNITIEKNNLFVINGHVDVLESFKKEIKENEAVINRSINYNNTMMQDNEGRIYQTDGYTIIRKWNNEITPFSYNTYILTCV